MTITKAAPAPPKGSRITLAVDVSHSVKSEHIPILKAGWASINEALVDDDLVALSTFGVTTNNIFTYVPANSAQWDGKDSAFNKIALEVQDMARGHDLALYDSIIRIVRDCPRNLKYKKHRPEMIFFVIGADNTSSSTLEQLTEALSNPRATAGGVHITVIDASDGGNAELKDVLEKMPHCSYFPCKADKAEVKKAFDTCKKEFKTRVRAAAAAAGAPPGAEPAAETAGDEEDVKAKPAKTKAPKTKGEKKKVVETA